LFVVGINAYYENKNKNEDDDEDEDINENWQQADAERLAQERIKFEGLVEERIAEELLKFETDKRNAEKRLAEERCILEENKRDAEWQLAEERHTSEANKRDAELYLSQQIYTSAEHKEAREEAEWRLSETLKAKADAARQQDLRLEAVEKRHREAQQEATAAAEKRHREAQEEATAAVEMRHHEAQEEQQQRVAAAAAADCSNSIAKVRSSPQNSDLENQGTNLTTTSPLAASPAFSMGSNDRRKDHTCLSFLERATGDERKEEYLNHSLGRMHQGANMDKRLNATKNKGRNKRDTKVTKRRNEGTSATTMQQAPDVASSPTLRRSLRGDRSVPQSPGIWNHIAEGGLLQDPDIHEQGDAEEEALMNTM
jgi:hypothetical protein